MELLNTFDLGHGMQAIVVAWCAIALERVVPISKAVDPLAFYRFVCTRMANKVLKANYSSQQALISGSLGLLVLIIPTLIIVYLLHSFASYQWLLNIFIVWLLIQFTQDKQQFSVVINALNANKKQLAKDTLQPLLLRKTNSLSPLGLCKASAEGLFLRYNHQQVTVLFWFLLAGPMAALVYRLLYEANQAWNPKLSEFASFGKFASTLTRALQFIPAWLNSITFPLTSSPSAGLKLIASKLYWQVLIKNTQSLLLLSLSQSLQVKTGGPVMYGSLKIRRERYSTSSFQAKEPKLEDINTLISLRNRHLMVSMLITTWLVFWFSKI